MTTARIRSLLAATAVAAVLAYGVSGHGLPQMGHDDMAGAVAGLCLLLVTVLPLVVMRRPASRDALVAAERTLEQIAAPPIPPLDARARASPRALQRFLN
jgi:hypothetical protein